MEITKKIELLAPARDLATGCVAVDAGADAVYIGGPGFGARRAAGNSLDDVAALVRYARPFGVRVYATLNTLLPDQELDEARRVALGLMEAGVDALIVQDMAFLRMGLSGVELHASTQTSNTVPEEVAFLGRAGFRRVILERALSLYEIRAVRAACPEETELEVFVHGALCVGYSGRCFMSKATDSARSGNRGDCSQPCRLAYDLVDGEGNVLIKGKHLLSLGDLDLSARLGELLDAGVSSFKIEGRLKDEVYVRNVVSHYRRLLDEALAAQPGLRRASVGTSVPDFTPDPAKSFTRGGGNAHTGLFTGTGTEYYLDGVRRGAASFDTPKAMGEFIGRVEKAGCERTGNRFFTVENPAARLAPGDGICFLAGGGLRGTNINRVEGGRVYPDKCEEITSGTKIFRNHDHAFVRALERSRMKRRIGVDARVEMSPSQVEVTFTDETGLSATVTRQGEFPPANDSAKMAATMRGQLAKSGDTIFEVRGVEVPAGGTFFVPVSMLAPMRREGLERLLEARTELVPERNPAAEDTAARFPRTKLTAEENVTNRLAESFWRDHGVTETGPALELRGANPGEAVMRTRYCIRRELDRCLKEGQMGPMAEPGPESGPEGRQRDWSLPAELPRDLYIEHGKIRWRLAFDCNKCEMKVLKI